MELPVINLPGRPRGFPARAVLLRIYRLAVVIAIVWLLQRHAARLRIDGNAPITVSEIKPLLPNASRLSVDTSDRRGLFVFDSSGQRVGYALRTSPISDKITGYAGPTDTLVVLDLEMRVVGIRIRSSADTRTHVRNVADDEYFMKLWTGKSWDQVAGMDPKTTRPMIEGVSGASLTSLAMANGIYQRFRPLEGVKASSGVRIGRDDLGMLLVIIAACLMAFTHLRGWRWARRGFQVLLIGYVGFWNGQLLAQSLWSGWAMSSIPWRLAPGLVLLAATALIVPWTTRRAIYCSQICPHGVAQELLGRLSQRKIHLPRVIESALRWVPGLLLVLVLIVTFHQLPFDLAGIEPFDAYLVRHAGIATVAVAVVGLLASLVLPMAYCKYGCPTGMVLSFVRSHGQADRFSWKDIAGAMMVGIALLLYRTYPMVHQWILR